jgi:hypothetical protein
MMVKKKYICFPSLTEVDWILNSPCNLCSDIYKCVAEFTSKTKLEVFPISISCSKLSLEPQYCSIMQGILKEEEYSVKDTTNTVLKIPQMHINKMIAGAGRHDKYVIVRVINECKISGHCLSVKLLI